VARAKAQERIDFEGRRTRIVDSKRAGLKRLPELAAEFTLNAEQAGATVHFCRTRDDANRTVHRIMQEQGASSWAIWRSCWVMRD
jgi:L-lactate utilization protein LutB